MAYNSAYTGPQVDEAVGTVRAKASTWDDKQNKLSGTEDQIVGFNSAGEAVAVAAPNPLPDGGTAGQVLTKTEDGEEWQDPPDGLPEGGTEGQVLTKTPTGAQWDDVPSDIPTGGTQGQVLTKGDGETVEWSDPASGLPTGGTPGQMLYQGASGPEWGDKPVMYVNITGNDNSGYQADKTFAAIQEAYQNKYAVFAIYQGGVFPLYQLVENAQVIFYHFSATQTVSISVISDDSVYVDRYPAYASDISFTPGTTGLTSDNVQDAIEEVNDKVVESTSATITLFASGWTGSAAPFSQQVACSIVAADTPVVMVDVDTPGTDADADDEATNAWALVSKRNVDQGAGTLTFYCTEKPTINIPVKVGVA